MTNKYDNALNLDTLQENAIEFADAGYKLMRLHGIADDGSCACGWSECKNAGKHPSTKGWSTIQAASSEQVESWFEVGAVNHGLGIVLDSDVVIVDVDEKNGGLTALEKLENAIGHKLQNESTFIIESGSGKGSRHYWFKKPKDTSIKKTLKEYPGLDFLSSGSYVVMAGSVHKSGGVYSYPYAKKSNPKNLSDAPELLLNLIERKYTFSESHAEPGSCDIAELREALNVIPNNNDTGYDDVWLPIGMALHHETNGDEHGFTLWQEWSEKGPKHDDTQMRYKWDSFADGAFNGRGYTGGTIFGMAFDNGWERDYSKLVNLAPFLERLSNGQAQQVEIVKNDIVYKNESLPAVLKNAPGMIGIIADYIMSQAPKPLYLPSLAAAMAYCSVTLGRDYRSDLDNYTSLYFINTAPTGAGKEKPRSIIKDILVATNQSKIVRNSPTSKGAVTTALIESPRTIFTIDEIGHFIESGNGRNGNQNRGDVRATLMEIFALCGSTFIPETYSRMTDYKNGVEDSAPEVDLTIHKPAVTVLGMTTPAKLVESITKMMIQDGFINRFIVVQAHEGRQKMQRVNKRPIPQSVLNWTESALNRKASAGNLATFIKDSYKTRQDEVILSFSEESLTLISEYEDYVLDKQSHLGRRGLDALYDRCIEQAMRLALIVELACRPQSDKIERESTEFAIEFVKYNAQQFERLVDFELVESRQEGYYRDALKAINGFEAKGASKSDLFKVSPFKGMKKAEKTDVLQHLLDTDLILLETVPTGGAPKQVFYGREYVSFKE